MLKKKVKERICSFTQVKEEKFFKSFDWDKLIDFKLTAPFIPKANIEEDYSKIIYENQDDFIYLINKESFKYQNINNGKDEHNEEYDSKWANEF